MLTASEKFDIHAPKKYLEYAETPAWRAFRDKENQASGASNYAVLKKLEEAPASIEAVEAYYAGTRCVPKFMFPADSVPPAQARGALIKAGYVLSTRPAVRMHWQGKVSPLLLARRCPVQMLSVPLAGAAAALPTAYAGGQDYVLKVLNRQLARGARAFVALQDGQPVSLCVGLGYADAFCIQLLYTAEGSRRIGCGAAALLAALAWARAEQQNYADIFLDCDPDDADALRLFGRAGFAGQEAPVYCAFKSLVPPGWRQCLREEL